MSARSSSRRVMHFFAANSALEKLGCFIALAVSLKLNVSRLLTLKIRRLNQRFLSDKKKGHIFFKVTDQKQVGYVGKYMKLIMNLYKKFLGKKNFHYSKFS
jgi:hypothetical protein